jgi:hypothetical protein
MWLVLACARQSLFPIGGLDHLESLGLETEPEYRPEIGFVIHDQNSGSRFGHHVLAERAASMPPGTCERSRGPPERCQVSVEVIGHPPGSLEPTSV